MSMFLNIREMISGNPARLRYVFRYSTSRVSHPESVAEHSFYVAFYAMLVGRWHLEHTAEVPTYAPAAKERACELMTVLMQRALLHDLEEARSGDFPRPFKHSNPTLKHMLEEASKHAFAQVIEPVLRDMGQPYDESVADEYTCSWMDSKDDTLPGRILEFCDFLAVLGFMLEECNSGANRSIKAHVADMGAYFEKFLTPAYAFIRPLVLQAGELMKEIFGGPSGQA